jgi:sulfur carrier protein
MPNTSVETIEIVVNGEQNIIPDGLTVLALLSHLGVQGERVAVELNHSIVRRDRWEHVPVTSGAQLEIVQFVGGG